MSAPKVTVEREATKAELRLAYWLHLQIPDHADCKSNCRVCVERAAKILEFLKSEAAHD